MNNLFFQVPMLSTSAVQQTLSSAVTLFIVLLCVVALLAIVLEIMRLRSPSRSQRKTLRLLTIPVYLVVVTVLVFTILCSNRLNNLDNPQLNQPSSSQQSSPDGSSVPSSSVVPPTTAPTVPTTPSLPATPHKTENSDPKNWNVKWEINVNGSFVDSYNRAEAIEFGSGDSYFSLPGIAGFRGNNYRTGATYGTANVTNKKLTAVWEQTISALPKSGDGAWTGAGWTGQPLVVQWDEETKAIMNLKPEAKAKKDLVEVIYATLDGHIYFYDLETGEYTRDPLFVGMAFKGAGALDPRGYPIMYVGSGDRTREQKQPRMYIISLIDCSIMYEYGYEKEFNIRSWRAFDSSPLVDAETDTLIWPGENGLIYTIKLNTNYDKAAGTLSIDPDKPVFNRYMTDLNTNPSNDLGFENSAIIVENYLYVGDNRGTYFCVDLNTMELVWAQEIKDDLNATAVFEWSDDGQGYIYLGTSMEYSDGTCYMYKLNAVTGEIVWEVSWGDIVYNKNVSGGILSSPLLGQKGTELEGMIIFHVAKSPSEYEGTTIALDTDTGEVIWQKNMKYCWSSPVAVYSEDGNAYVILFDSVGNCHLLDGQTGSTLDTINVGSNVEASPVVFNDMLIIGTRGQKVYGIKIS
ncbi:MAG: pyrrolo-quinoline quinone [Ruminococcaceae bacterium]|nr:pyrrolo-quinoline quinone [Oscillospiraceae bacterium]